MVSQDNLSQRLVTGKGQASRVASRIRLASQFKVADDVLIEAANP
jgi:hypothetical protein